MLKTPVIHKDSHILTDKKNLDDKTRIRRSIQTVSAYREENVMQDIPRRVVPTSTQSYLPRSVLKPKKYHEVSV
jgi:hypothetical protein